MTPTPQGPGMPASADVTEPMSAATSRSTVSTTATTATAMTAGSRKSDRMGATMRSRRQRSQSHSLASVSVRLSQLYGESPQTWAHRLSGEASWYRGVQKMNGVLRMMGELDRLTELMIPVEMSLGPESALPLEQALHEAELADCREQEVDEVFRHKLHAGTATVADAETYLRASAIQCAKAEGARLAVHQWLDAQRGQP